MGKIKISPIQKKRQRLTTPATTIAVLAFAVIAYGSLGGSAYGQPDRRPVDPPNPSPPGQQLIRCPDGFELVDRDTCEGEPRLECREGFTPSRSGDGTCERIIIRAPDCPVGQHLSEDSTVCLDNETNEPASLPFCENPLFQREIEPVTLVVSCVRVAEVVDPSVPVCDIGELNEETGMCEVRPIRGNRP